MSVVLNRPRRCAQAVGIFLVTAAWTAGAALAQSPVPPPVTPALPDGVPGAKTEPPPAANPYYDTGIVQTGGCVSCGDNLPPPHHADGDGGCGCGGGCGPCKGCGCIPGQPKCYCECCCDPQTCLGRIFAGFYNCICCPDPCWLPHWDAVRDVAFFQDAARPVTQTKLTWDNGWNFKNPDRAEFFWARERTNPNQLGPGNCAPFSIGKGPTAIARSVNYHEVDLYTEAASGAAGLFISIPYIHISPETGAANAGLMPPTANKFQEGLPLPGIAGVANLGSCPASGFSDMTIGTKSMILDCDCVQLTFQFKTWLPIGDFTRGLGTGHVSLEPSLLFGVKLTEDWFSQMQIAYWIPIGGDPLYETGVFHCHLSLNRYLWSPCPGLKLVGTMEFNEWSVCGGAYTDPDLLVTDPSPTQNGAANPNLGKPAPVSVSATSTIFSMGPGVRFVVCDKIDVGLGTAFALTGVHWAEELLRFEFRWRF